MMKKFAALGLTAALVFAPIAAFAEDAAPATPAASTDAGAMAKPAMKPKMKSHKMKSHKMKSHKMKKKMAPAADATPAATPAQ